MAIDYDTQILPLFGSDVVTDPEYSSIPANLRDQTNEQRILTTIEVLKSHIETLGNRTEANLLMEAIGRELSKIGSGGFVYQPRRISVEGNRFNPTFAPGSGVIITTSAGAVPADTPAGGSLATVVSELNLDLGGGTAEVAQFTALAESPDGALGGTYLTINGPAGAPTEDYYVWFNHAARAEVTDVTLQAGSAYTQETTAGVAPTTAGDYWDVDDDTTSYRFWYNVVDALDQEIPMPGAGAGGWIGAGSPANYFTLDVPFGHPQFPGYYVWFNVFNAGGNSDPGAVGPAVGSLTGRTGIQIDVHNGVTTTAALLVGEILTNPISPTLPGARGLAVPSYVPGDEFLGSGVGTGAGDLNVINTTWGANSIAVDGIPGQTIVFAGPVVVNTAGVGPNVAPAAGGKTLVPIGPFPTIYSDVLVAIDTRTALGAVNVALSGADPTITMTQNVAGDVPDATNSGGALTGAPTIVTTGLDAPTDPAVTTNAVMVNYTLGGADNVIAGEVRAAITAQAGAVFSTGGAGALIQVTNILEGDAPDATAGTTGWAAPIITDGGPGVGGPIEAYATPDGRLGFRTTLGNEGISFTVSDGAGGIIGPAGVIPGDYLSSIQRSANEARDDAISIFLGQPRNTTL